MPCTNMADFFLITQTYLIKNIFSNKTRHYSFVNVIHLAPNQRTKRNKKPKSILFAL